MENRIRGLRGTILSPEKQAEYEALAKGARGETRFGGISEQLGLTKAVRNTPEELEQQREQGFSTYEAPITEEGDMEKIKMLDPKYRARKEAEMQQRWEPSQAETIQEEPSRIEVEKYMRETGVRPGINESDELFYNRIKKLMQEK